MIFAATAWRHDAARRHARALLLMFITTRADALAAYYAMLIFDVDGAP